LFPHTIRTQMALAFGLLCLLVVAISAPAQSQSADSMGQVNNIAPAADKIRPLLIGAEIPDVTVGDLQGNSVRLRDIVSHKPTIMIFYRGGW